MWGIKRNKLNSQVQTNKAKAGSIKNSTIEVKSSGNDETVAIILREVLNMKDDLSNIKIMFDERIDHVENTQKAYVKGFNIYVQNNGVKPDVKKRVEDILSDIIDKGGQNG